MAIGGILNQETDVTGFATKAELKQEIDKVNQSLGTLPGVPKLVGSWDYTFTKMTDYFYIFDNIPKETLANYRGFYIVTEFTGDIYTSGGNLINYASVGICASGNRIIEDGNLVYINIDGKSTNIPYQTAKNKFGKNYKTFINNYKTLTNNPGDRILYPMRYNFNLGRSTVVFNDPNETGHFHSYHIGIESDGSSPQFKFPMRFSVYVIE